MVCLGATSFGADRGKQPRFAPYPPPIPAPSQVGDADHDGDSDDSLDRLLQFLQSQANMTPALTHMTKNRLMVTDHSKDVPEILPLNRMTKFDFPPHFLVRLMHSFPMMYNTI